MAKNTIKYKFLYLEDASKRDPSAKSKDIKILMEEARVGDVVFCDKQEEILNELKQHVKNGWELRVKKPVKDWGYFLYMEKMR